jgi:uncharacterized protein YkwD
VARLRLVILAALTLGLCASVATSAGASSTASHRAKHARRATVCHKRTQHRAGSKGHRSRATKCVKRTTHRKKATRHASKAHHRAKHATLVRHVTRTTPAHHTKPTTPVRHVTRTTPVHHTKHPTPIHGHSRSAAPAGQSACPDADLMPQSENLPRIRVATLCLINQERALHGESALQTNAKLEQAAQGHTEDMSSGHYFEHVSPRGDTPLSRMFASGYIYSHDVGYDIGENIAWGTLSLATPRAIVNAWIASPEHLANILNAHYRDTAIGVSANPPASLASGQPGAIYTQDFGVIITG